MTADMTDKGTYSDEPVYLSVSQGLVSAGDTLSFEGVLDVCELEMAGRRLTLENGISYDVAVTNTGEGLLLTGIARLAADTLCDRCLGPARLELAAEVSCYYLREAASYDEDDEDEDWDIGVIDEVNGRIDIRDAIMGAVLGEMPFVILCSEDCQGLCPHCGANLNEGPCSCASEGAIDPMNPFAVLDKLKYGNAEK